MKRIIIIAVFVLMVGWAIYEFVADDDSSTLDDATEEVETETSTGQDGASVASDIEVDEDSGSEGLEPGDMAPDVLLRTVDGEEVHLSDFRGEPVMLNFWGTWCPPCRAEIPDMEEFHQDTDINIVAVNLIETESSVEDVENFIDEYDMTISVYLDENNAVAETYRIQPVPTSYLINADGTIHNVALGALNYDLMIQEYEKMN